MFNRNLGLLLGFAAANPKEGSCWGFVNFSLKSLGFFFSWGAQKQVQFLAMSKYCPPKCQFLTHLKWANGKRKNPKSPILEHFFQFRGVDFFEILQVIRGFYLLRILFLIFFLSWRESPGPLPQEPPQIFSSESAGKGEIFGVRCG